MTGERWDAERLRSLRRRCGWSQQQLAEAINERTGMRSNRHRVSEWESGRITPGYVVQRALDQIEREHANG